MMHLFRPFVHSFKSSATLKRESPQTRGTSIEELPQKEREEQFEGTDLSIEAAPATWLDFKFFQEAGGVWGNTIERMIDYPNDKEVEDRCSI